MPSALKPRVWGDAQDNKQIPGQPARLEAGLPVPRHPEHHPIFDPPGDGQCQRFFTLEVWLPPARGAARRVYKPLPLAASTRHHLLHAEAPLAPVLDPVPAPLTARTRGGLCAWLGPGAMAGGTDRGPPQRQEFVATRRHPLQWDGEGGFKVRPTGGLRPALVAQKMIERAGPGKVEPQTAKEVAKVNGAEEVLGDTHTGPLGCRGIKRRPFLRVGEHRIRLGNRFKPLFGLRGLVPVWVVGKSQLAKGAFDGLRIGIPGDAKDGVVILVLHWHNLALAFLVLVCGP